MTASFLDIVGCLKGRYQELLAFIGVIGGWLLIVVR
jgi:Na+(H+)/acetate symporter ActP